MGVFSIPIELRNWQNRFLPAEAQGEAVHLDALVDTGSMELALPAEVVRRLKLEDLGEVRAYTANGARLECRVVGIVEIHVQGRSCRVQAIELPEGTQALLGAVPLEVMDWHVSPGEMKLLPNPLSPDEPLIPLV